MYLDFNFIKMYSFRMRIIFIIFLSFIYVIIFPAITKMQKKTEIKIKNFLYSFILSCLAFIVSIILQNFLAYLFIGFIKNSKQILTLYQNFFEAAFIEEISKVLFFLIFIKIDTPALEHGRRTSGIERSAGINSVYKEIDIKTLLYFGVFFGLIFSSFENIAYSIHTGNFIPVRLVTANLLHGFLTLYYIKIHIAHSLKHKIIFFTKTFLLHGLYNMFFYIGGYFIIFSCAILIFIIFTFVGFYNENKYFVKNKI